MKPCVGEYVKIDTDKAQSDNDLYRLHSLRLHNEGNAVDLQYIEEAIRYVTIRIDILLSK